VAAEQSTHDGQHPIQNMYQQDVLQVLSATRFSIFSKKGNKSTAPNQDRVLVAQLAGSMVLMAVLDGHGEVGHDVAEACTEVLPKLLLQRLSKLGMPSATSPGGSGSFFGVQNPQEAAGGGIADWWKEGAIRAFEEVHSLLEALTAQVMSSDDKESNLDALAGTANLKGLGGYSKIDSRTSGTTATVVLLIPGQRILVAHVGDSRAVLGVRRRGEGSAWRIRELTRDHKPDLPDERARIELFGAQVITVGNPPNTTCRVFTPQQAWPSINMSRSLGDLHAHSQGLSAEAEVFLVDKAWDPATEEAVLVVASDGIWDVLDGPSSVDMAWQSAMQGSDPATALADEAYQRWGRRGLQGGYTDDISVVVKIL